MDDISPNKILQNHSRIYCNYNTRSKKDYIKHLTTRKHKRMTKELQKDDDFTLHEQFICECGSKYKYRQGLWKHKKICYKKEVPEEECNTQIK